MLLQHICEAWHVTVPKATPKDVKSAQNNMLKSHLVLKRPFGQAFSNVQVNARSYCFNDNKKVGFTIDGMGHMLASFNGYSSNPLSASVGNYQNAINSRNFFNFNNFYMNSCNRFGLGGSGGSQQVFNVGYGNFRGSENIMPSYSENNLAFSDNQYVDFSQTRRINAVGPVKNQLRRGTRNRPYWHF